MLSDDESTLDREGKRELMLKRIGFFGGSKALGEYLHGGAEASSGRGLQDHVEQVALRKVLEAASYIDSADKKSRRELLAILTALQAARHHEKPLPAAQANYVKNVEAMLREIPWSIGSSKVLKKMRKWEQSAVELRADEAMRVMAGEKLKNEEELKSSRLRDPDQR